MKNTGKKRFPEGVLTAIITPFQNGEIDYPAFARLLALQEEGGIRGIVLLGTTGEAPTVLPTERKALIEFTKKHTTLPVIVGASSSDTQKSLVMTKEAEEWGADGLLVASPYYNKPSEDGMTEHFLKIADNVHIPIMLYNIPSRTGSKITAGVLRAVAGHPNISALKEADSNFTDILSKASMLRALPEEEKIDIYSGNDSFYMLFRSFGARGLVSVASNLYTELSRITDQDGEKFLQYIPLFSALSLESNPLPIKTLMASRGMIHEEFRLPLCPMRQENKKRLLETAALY